MLGSDDTQQDHGDRDGFFKDTKCLWDVWKTSGTSNRVEEVSPGMILRLDRWNENYDRNIPEFSDRFLKKNMEFRPVSLIFYQG